MPCDDDDDGGGERETKIIGYDEESGSFATNTTASPTNLEVGEALNESGAFPEHKRNTLMDVLNTERKEDKETGTPIGSIQNTPCPQLLDISKDSLIDAKTNAMLALQSETKQKHEPEQAWKNDGFETNVPNIDGDVSRLRAGQHTILAQLGTVATKRHLTANTSLDREASSCSSSDENERKPISPTPTPDPSSKNTHPQVASSPLEVEVEQQGGDRRAQGDQLRQSPHAHNEVKQPEIDIPLDSFSMLFAAQDWVDCLLPLVVFGVQMTILCLLLFKLSQTSNRPRATPLNMPVGVPVTVKISQYIACLVTIFSAEDLITGIVLAGKRIVPLGQALPTGERPAVSWTWEASNLLRTIEGALVMVVSFVFIVQSSNAIDLWLNFAGVAFVGFLDDAVFALATNNIFGVRVLRLSKRVGGFQVYSNDEEQLEKTMKTIRYGFMLGLTAIMWAMLSVFVPNKEAWILRANPLQ